MKGLFFTQFHSTSTTVRVAEGDIVTAKYHNNASSSSELPDIHTTAEDEIDTTATAYIGHSPYDPCNDYANYNDPKCRHPTIKIVDIFGNTLNTVNVDQ